MKNYINNHDVIEFKRELSNYAYFCALVYLTRFAIVICAINMMTAFSNADGATLQGLSLVVSLIVLYLTIGVQIKGGLVVSFINTPSKKIKSLMYTVGVVGGTMIALCCTNLMSPCYWRDGFLILILVLIESLCIIKIKRNVEDLVSMVAKKDDVMESILLFALCFKTDERLKKQEHIRCIYENVHSKALSMVVFVNNHNGCSQTLDINVAVQTILNLDDRDDGVSFMDGWLMYERYAVFTSVAYEEFAIVSLDKAVRMGKKMAFHCDEDIEKQITESYKKVCSDLSINK